MNVLKGFKIPESIKSIQWQFLGAIVLSYMLYSFFSNLILAVVTIPLVWLWPIALIPVWFLAFQLLKKKINQALKFKIDAAKQQCIDNESFLADPLFDRLDLDTLDINLLTSLQKNANRFIKAAEDRVANLLRKNWREYPWIIDSNLSKKKTEYTKRLTTQKNAIQNKLTLFANNIADKITSKIVQLKPAFTKEGGLTPLLQPLELEILVQFINLYASKAQKESLSQNTELINIFTQDLSLSHLKSPKFIYKTNQSESFNSPPWGRYARFSAHFRGWHHLIQGWMVQGNKKEAMLELLAALEGLLELTPAQFDEKIAILGRNQKLEKRIRQHLFLLLEYSSQVLLLHPQDQEKIRGWFEKNKSDIQTGQDFINAILDGTIVEEVFILNNLAQHIQLLDNATLICHISKIQPEYAFAKRAEVYFEQYKGDHCLAHCLLRFLPSSPQRAILLNQICTKRLYWLIEEMQTNRNDKDTNLFNDREALWDFDICVRKHSYFSQYTMRFDNFLQVAVAHGFCTPTLITEYQSKNASI